MLIRFSVLINLLVLDAHLGKLVSLLIFKISNGALLGTLLIPLTSFSVLLVGFHGALALGGSFSLLDAGCVFTAYAVFSFLSWSTSLTAYAVFACLPPQTWT